MRCWGNELMIDDVQIDDGGWACPPSSVGLSVSSPRKIHFRKNDCNLRAFHCNPSRKKKNCHKNSNTKSLICTSSIINFFCHVTFRNAWYYTGTMTRKISLPILLLFASTGISFSQTNVFWFGDSTNSSVNNRIISIKENSDGNLFLLGKATDSDYNNIHPYFAVCDKNGNLKSQKTVQTTNDFYELNNFTICGADKIRIWGTEKSNNDLTISLNTINTQGELQSADAMMTMTTTLTGDVFQMNDSNAILAKTVKSSSTGKFHISIYEYNVQNDRQVWYKTLMSDDNEEASKIVVLKDNSIILLGKSYSADLASYTSLVYKLSPTGELVWKKNIQAYETFYAQGIAETKNKNLVYACSIGSEVDATGSTKMISLDSSGNTLGTNEIQDIRANGILALNNGNLFLYGSHYQKTGVYIISKACYKIYNPDLKKINEDEMGMFDGPDADLPSLAMTAWPTASDFITAIQLSDGRIACAGRVYMPDDIAPDKIILSGRSNKAFLVLMDANGKFRNQ